MYFVHANCSGLPHQVLSVAVVSCARTIRQGRQDFPVNKIWIFLYIVYSTLDQRIYYLHPQTK